MGRILRNWRITLASLFSVALITGTYFFARSIESPPLAQASAESALLHAIATKDSDGDRLADWEEALYGTSPNKVDSHNLGMTDSEAVTAGLIVAKAIANVPVATSTRPTFDTDGLPPPPAEGTLTAAFTKSFFTLYLTAKQNVGGADLTDTQLQDIANQALSALAASIARAPNYKNQGELTIAASGRESLITFAATVESLVSKTSNTATTTDLNYLKYAQSGDSTAFRQLAAIAKSYRDSAVAIAAVPVPRELAIADLALVNTLMRMSKTIGDFTLVDSDPLTAILALTQYPLVVQDLAKAFTDIGAVYAVSGVVVPAGSPGARFVNMMADTSL